VKPRSPPAGFPKNISLIRILIQWRNKKDEELSNKGRRIAAKIEQKNGFEK
jgi:hypothetical protein